MRRFLDVKQCAEYLNVSVYFLYRLVEKKQIPHARLGKKILFDVEKLEKFIDESSIDVQDWSEKVRDWKR